MKKAPFFWLEKLIDREADVETLMSAYRAMLQASAPTCTVVIAESGIGKTRLAREFYLRLAREIDPKEYWPRRFDGDLLTMDIVPDFKNQASNSAQSIAPFIWWPVRFSKPDARNRLNSGGTAITQSIGQLLPHLSVVSQAAVIAESKKSSIDLALDTLIEYAPDMFFPGAGFAKTCLAKAYEGWKQRKELKKLKSLTDNSASDSDVKAQEEIAPILESLSSFLRAGSNGTGQVLPVVLLLDDLQFADTKEIIQLTALLKRAASESWPLMVLGTTWSTSWDAGLTQKDTPLGRFQLMIREVHGVNPSQTEIRLKKISGDSELISAALPGLQRDQREVIRNRFSGDLYTLALCLRKLLAQPTNFENKNVSLALNQAGMKLVCNFPVDRAAAIQERFNELPESYQITFGVAALLGHRSLLPLAHDIALELASISFTTSSSTDLNLTSELTDGEGQWLLRKFAPNLGEFVEEVSRAVASEKFTNIDEDLCGVLSASVKVIQRWIDDGTAERLSYPEVRHFISGSKSILARIAENGFEIDSIDLNRLANCVQLIDEIENGFVLSDLALPAAVFTGTFLDETRALASMSVTWRARWLQRAGTRGPWLSKGGRPLALQLRNEAFKLVDDLSEQISQEGDHLNLVEAIGNAATTSVGLTWLLLNDSDLSGRNELNTYDSNFEERARELMETFRSLELETIQNLSHSIAVLEKVDKQDSYAARAILWYSVKSMTDKVAESTYDLFGSIARSIASINFKGTDREHLLSILFENGMLSDLLYGWGADPATIATKSLATGHLVDELVTTEIEAAGVYQLVTLVMALGKYPRSNDLSTVEADFELTLCCSLELIRRGLGELIVRWAPNLTAQVKWEIGWHPIQIRDKMKGNQRFSLDSQDLDRGWQKTAELLMRIKAVSDRSTEWVLNSLLVSIFYEMAEWVLKEDKSAYLEIFLEESQIAAKGAYRDAEICARLAWADSCTTLTYLSDSKSDICKFLANAYRGYSGVPHRVMRMFGRHDVHVKALEKLESELRNSGQYVQAFEITNDVALERLTHGFIANLEDWRDTTLEAVKFATMSAHELKSLNATQAVRLFDLWDEVWTSVSDRSDSWKSHVAEIEELVQVLVKK